MAGRFKTYFLRGLAVLLPTVVTIGIFVWGYTFIQKYIGVHINEKLVSLHMLIQGYDSTNEDVKDQLAEFWVQGWGSIAGFMVALIIVFVVGALLASVMGKTLWRMIENFIMNTPFLKGIYPYVKQVTDFLLTQEDQNRLFKRVVAVEYPRKGIWSMGFVTGSGLAKVKKQTIDLDMTIEEALRFTVSGGVITPSGSHAVALDDLAPPDEEIEG
ncbi:MAG: DUF502 domain-containing protein [Planctomycetota bacterium]